MTHPGPDFLPYPLPAVTAPTQQLSPPPTPPPTGGRWNRALDGLTPLGVVAIGSGLGALVLLLLVTGVAGREGPGLVVTLLAAAVSVAAGLLALRRDALPRDSRTLVVAAQAVGVLSALVAFVVYAAAGSSDEQPVAPPSPAPSASVSPAPAAPAPGVTPAPQLSLPPGAANGFGVPSDPGDPQSQDPTALGTLYGHVVDTSGVPIKGAAVTVTRATPGDTSGTPQCPTRVTTLTDADGVYRLQLCQLGNGLGYHVRITVGKSTVEHDLFVNSGNTTVYDVILPR